MLLAIDPGNKQSAFLIYDTANDSICTFGKQDNDKIMDICRNARSHMLEHLAIEYMRPRGMPMSKESMDTQFFAGRLVQMFVMATGSESWTAVDRLRVKMHHCGHASARDSNIRRALLDRYPATGGGATPQVGTKAQPGPLYGVAKDVWSALAIATYWADTREQRAA